MSIPPKCPGEKWKDFSVYKDAKYAPPKKYLTVIIQYSVAFVKLLVYNLF